MSNGKTIEEVEVELIHETEDAWLLDNGNKQDWFPKSMCALTHGASTDLNVYVLSAPFWLLNKKEFI